MEVTEKDQRDARKIAGYLTPIGSDELGIGGQILHFERMLQDHTFLMSRLAVQDIENGLSHKHPDVRNAARKVVLYLTESRNFKTEALIIQLAATLSIRCEQDARIEALELLHDIANSRLPDGMLRRRIETIYAEAMATDQPENVQQAARHYRDQSREYFFQRAASVPENLKAGLEAVIVEPIFREGILVEFYQYITLRALELGKIKSDDLLNFIEGAETQACSGALNQRDPRIRLNSLQLASKALGKGFLHAVHAQKIIAHGLKDCVPEVQQAAQDLQTLLPVEM